MATSVKKKVHRYMTSYMCLGMLIGAVLGVIFAFIQNYRMGSSVASTFIFGLCLGMIVGIEKDKRLSKNMMEISRIEAVHESSDMFVYAIDKEGVEIEYRVSKKKMKREKFSVGNRIAEDKDGSLVTLESN